MSRLTKGRAVRELQLGLKVQKEALTVADIDLFTVYGMVLITLITGEVTAESDAGPTTILLEEKASSVDLCAATTIDTDAVGTMYFLTGDPAIALSNDIPVLKVAGLPSATPHNPIIFDGQAGLTIELTQTGADATGKVKWTLFYIPLEDNAYVTAA